MTDIFIINAEKARNGIFLLKILLTNHSNWVYNITVLYNAVIEVIK